VPSQWLAVGAEIDPLRRARELQRSWERLLADGALGPHLPPGAIAGLRPTIVESWRRSLATGLDPTDLMAPIEADESEVLGRWFEHPLGSLTEVLPDQLRKVAEESRSVVVVTDASGLVLHRVGDDLLKERAAEMNLVEGARYSEGADGTNGIGTALAADQAFQVFAFEHFNERHHDWVCSGAPVHDPVSGRVVAVVDLSSLWKTAHPRGLELVTTAARTIEQRLFQVRRDQDARLRRRYGDLMTRSTDLLVSRDGYVLAGAEPAHSKPLDIPKDGGEVVLGDGSVAVAEPLGQDEAYLLSRGTARRAKSAAPVEGLDRAERYVRELVTEQAALRQVATLVARESSPDQLFAAVTEQVARIFDVPHVRLVRYEPDSSVVIAGFSKGDPEPFPIGSRWPLESPGVIATVRQTGRPARVEDYAHVTGEIAAVVRGAGMRSAVASPIGVERRLWGAMVVLSPRREPFPEDTEARLTDFTELVATAIANAESRGALALLADEQAALRRVATLVAQGASPQDLFEAVAEEVGRLLPLGKAAMGRYEPDGSVTSVASWSTTESAFAPGSRWPAVDTNVASKVLQTGRSAHFSAATEPIGVAARETGVKSGVGSPIVVEGHLWGVMTVTSAEGTIPPGTEGRLASFTALVATAIANAESQSALEQLADEQAALRRVATLVARDAPSTEVFEAVATEVGKLLETDITVVGRYDDDSVATAIGSWSSSPGAVPVGTRSAIGGRNVLTIVAETGKPARVDGYDDATGEAAEIARGHRWRSSIAAPIVVEGRVWGVMLVATLRPEPFPVGAEERLAAFTDLVASAVANAQAHDQVRRFGEEQATLRRIATLVAKEVQPEEVFAAVTEEVAATFRAITAVMRFEHDSAEVVLVGASNEIEEIDVPIGARWQMDDALAAAEVYRTGRSARVGLADWSSAGGAIGEAVRRLGIVSTVASPISVEGSLWGAITVNGRDELPPDTEQRLEKFTDLVTTAIANAEGKSELAASRRRIVAASDETRRRIERDLHDGTQQLLVSLGLALRAAEADLPPERADLHAQVSKVAAGLVAAVEDLQEISRGIHPAILSKGGLGPALRALAHRSAIPVDLDIATDVRLAEPIEVAAYFVASEALANAAKHSDATHIDVSLGRRDGNLLLSVRDDGVGGADAARGSGIVGLNDRVEALGGSLRVDSSPGEGTQIVAQLPLEIELERPV
jgi:signal transduction histidine kinase/putative methionine-R-sulfoxide reductase with GAF domain